MIKSSVIKVLKILMLMVVILVSFGNNTIYATDNKDLETKMTEQGLPDLDNYNRPSVHEGKVTEIIVKILNVLTVLGVIAIVVFLAIIGFSSILGSASEKAIAQEKYIGFVVGAILITSGSVIAKLIISLAESI